MGAPALLALAGSHPLLDRTHSASHACLLLRSLRKFLNLPTFLIANDWNRGETWAHSHDYFEISGAGDTTNGNVLQERVHILFGMFIKGA